MLIDCDSCVMRATAACDDCIVTFLLDRPEGAIVFDADEERALRIISAAGLAPVNRYTPRHAQPDRQPAREVIPLSAGDHRGPVEGGEDEEAASLRSRPLRGRKLA